MFDQGSGVVSKYINKLKSYILIVIRLTIGYQDIIC